MQYLIEVYLYCASFLLVYALLLRNRNMYAINRLYLLAAAVLPFVLPFLKMPETVSRQLNTIPAFQYRLPEISINAGKQTDNTWLWWMLYAAICIAILAYDVWNVYQLQKLASSNEKEARDGYILIKDSDFGPGSFGKYIFFPTAEVNEAILAHEKAHIKLRHTADILFLNLLQAIAWPMLLLWFIKKEIREIHEFQADAMANVDKDDYTHLLVSSALHVNALPEMHLFIIHPLKRRIMMLKKNGTGSPFKKALLISSAMLAVTGSVLFVQSCNKDEPKKTQAKLLSPYDKMIPTGRTIIYRGNEMTEMDSVRQTAEVMPEPGYNLSEYLSQTIKYPQEAQKQKIEGRVMVKFVINKEGGITNVTVLRSPNELLTKEAVRVVSNMPKWKPATDKGQAVMISYTLPIMFKLS